MVKIILLSLLLVGCTVVRRPGRSVDSVIVRVDSFRTVVSGRDSVVHHKRVVSITSESRMSFKPLFWYSVVAAAAFTLYLFIKK